MSDTKEEAYQIILHLLEQFPSEASIKELMEEQKSKWTNRTWQRYLNELIESGDVIRKGRGRSTRYQLSSIPREFGAEITLSDEGHEVKEYISRPKAFRKPVGYNRDFIDQYVPNQTQYLSNSDRAQLRKLGKQPGSQKPAGTFARKIFDRLLIDLSWNSSRLEGNTYSLLETERLLFHGKEADEKSAFEAQMIFNHKAAIEFILDCAETHDLNLFLIRNIHALLSQNLLKNPKASGNLRKIPVGITGTVYHPLEIPQVIAEDLEQIVSKASQINDPFEQTFFMMVHIPYLQPFEDVNKRVSRLAGNFPLIKMNLCPLSFVDVDECAYVEGILGVYELNKIELLKDVFMWAYHRSALRYSAIIHSIGEPDLFRLHQRAAIEKAVRKVVISRLNKEEATKFIQEFAKNLSVDDRAHFIEVVETELLDLHIGNIARFKINEDQFHLWNQRWQDKTEGQAGHSDI